MLLVFCKDHTLKKEYNLQIIETTSNMNSAAKVEENAKDETCEIVMELYPRDSKNELGQEMCNETDVLEMNTKLRIPKSNNQVVTLLLLLLVTLSSTYSLLRSIYSDEKTTPHPEISDLLAENYTLINDTIRVYYLS